MASISEALAIAIQHHQAERLEAAEQICQQILGVDPNQVDALHLAGLTASRMGRQEVAAELIGRAIVLNGSEATFHSNLGAVLKAQGKLVEAVAACRRALELKPDSAAAHYNFGAALQAQGNPQEAVECFRRAVALKPDFEVAHNNLGTALLAQGKLDDAVACFRRTLELKPDYAVANYNLGTALQSQGRLDEAIACFRQAIELQPDFQEAHYNVATAFHAQGKLDKAVQAYRAALKLKPDDAVAHNHMGNALWIQGKLPEAFQSYRQAVALKPDYAEAHTNLGNALQFHGKLNEAIACCRRALEIKPDYAVAHNNLGNAFLTQGNLEEAIDCYRRAVLAKPDYAEAHSNLGNALQQIGRFDDALACFSKALELRADYPHAHYGRASLKLLTGDLESGWPEYEWRLKTNDYVHRKFTEPGWDGHALAQRTILLHAEGCLGDTLQFVRYAHRVKEQNPAAIVVLECQRSLKQLLATCPGIDLLVAMGDKLPAFDVHASLMSLPGILGTTIDTIPADVPYLFADPGLVDYWRDRLASVRGLRIGINWHGRPMTRHRDIPIECIKSLSEMPRVQFVSLQKGAARQQSTTATGESPTIIELGDDFDTVHGAFMDTAAVMMSLDVVLSSDTSIPHLAGALGVPVWLALPFVPDWRWLLDRKDSPWYPTMRLFRQREQGNWNSVFQDIHAALRERLGS